MSLAQVYERAGVWTYEKLEDEAEPDAETLRRHLAADAQPRFEALLAKDEWFR